MGLDATPVALAAGRIPVLLVAPSLPLQRMPRADVPTPRQAEYLALMNAVDGQLSLGEGNPSAIVLGIVGPQRRAIEHVTRPSIASMLTKGWIIETERRMGPPPLNLIERYVWRLTEAGRRMAVAYGPAPETVGERWGLVY